MSLVKWAFIGVLLLPAAEFVGFALVALAIGWLWQRHAARRVLAPVGLPAESTLAPQATQAPLPPTEEHRVTPL